MYTHTCYNVAQGLEFICNVYSNSRGWGHEAFALYKGKEVARKRIKYYNRTWEKFQFFDIMIGLVHLLDKDKSIPLSVRYQAFKYLDSI